MKSDLKIIKGSYINKKNRTDGKLPICPICSNCNYKDFCHNRTDHSLMRKCGRCKNCQEMNLCDKFYKCIQHKAVVTIGRDLKGNPMKRSFSATTEEEAVFKAMQYKKDVESGYIRDTVTTFKSFCDFAKANEENKLKFGDIKESTYLRNMELIKRFATHKWAKLPISKVTKEDIEDFLTSERHLSNSTLSKEYQMIKKVFTIAYDEKYIRENFFSGQRAIRLPKSLKEDKEVSALTLEEETLFINYIIANGTLYKNIYLLALYTGMRGGEIFALTKDDIDFKEMMINIDKTVSMDKNSNVIIGTTKTSNGRRKIVISKRCEPVLREIIKDMYPNKRNLLFCKPDGTMLNRSMTNSELRRICNKLKIKKISLHALRHTFATRCVEAGINFKAIQGFLGHADIQTTMDIYADLQNDFKRTEMNKLDNYFEDM